MEQVPVVQIDDTFDIKGFVYLNEFNKNIKAIAGLIGFELNKTIRSTKTSL